MVSRTKNNMAVISSMIQFEIDKYDDERITTILNEMNNRIHTMALVHKKLYQAKNLTSIDLSEYIIELISMLLDNYYREDMAIKFEHNCEKNISVTIDIAVPCGIIVNEIISNALKHGLSDSTRGKITLGISKSADNKINLIISDNGKGVPEDFNFRENANMGIQTIYAVGELPGGLFYHNYAAGTGLMKGAITGRTAAVEAALRSAKS